MQSYVLTHLVHLQMPITSAKDMLGQLDADGFKYELYEHEPVPTIAVSTVEAIFETAVD